MSATSSEPSEWVAPTPSLGEPTEVARLRAERDAAVAEVRRCEHENGKLRAYIRRLELVLWWINAPRRIWDAVLRRVRRLIERVRPPTEEPPATPRAPR